LDLSCDMDSSVDVTNVVTVTTSGIFASTVVLPIFVICVDVQVIRISEESLLSSGSSDKTQYDTNVYTLVFSHIIKQLKQTKCSTIFYYFETHIPDVSDSSSSGKSSATFL